MSGVLNVGLIGSGWQARNHMRGYQQSGNARIAAIANPNKESVDKLINEFNLEGVKYYATHQDLLADKSIEAVSILTPNRFHEEMVIAGAEAGKHILAEKPFVTSIDGAKAVWAALKKSGVKCAIGYQRRLNPICKEIVRLRDNGTLGRLVFVQSDFFHGLPAWMPHWKWLTKKANNPTPFQSSGGHCVDTITYLMNDEIAEVSAFSAHNLMPDSEVNMETCAIFRFKNGAIGKVASLSMKAVVSFEFPIEVFGTKGTMRNNKLILDTIPNYNDPKNKDNCIMYPNWSPDNTPGVTEPWDVMVMDFVDWVRGDSDGKELCKPKEAIRVFEACWGTVISNEEHRVVKLPLIEDLD